jgi:DNA-binding transcriptional LysR family regulator
MELRHLRYFVGVAEELNFRRAAARMYVAQGAFSDQIRKLERKLDVRLLDRTPRGVSLTDAGAALLSEARRVLHQADVARLAARNARDHATSRLRIGYMPAFLPASVPRAVERLAAAMPLVETCLEPGSADELIDAIGAGWLDAGVVSLPTCTDRWASDDAARRSARGRRAAGQPSALDDDRDLARAAGPAADRSAAARRQPASVRRHPR